MKAKERQQAKHDVFADALMSAGLFLSKHQRPIIVAAVVVVTLAAGVAWYVYSVAAERRQIWERVDEQMRTLDNASGPDREAADSLKAAAQELANAVNKKSQAAVELPAAEKALAEASDADREKAAKRVEELKALAESAKQTMDAASKKVESAQALAESAKKTHKETAEDVITRIREMITAAPDSPAGIYARYQLIQVLYIEERYEEAADACKKLLDSPNVPAAYRQMAETTYPGALEQAGKWSEAVALYQNRAAQLKDDAAAEATWSAARCLDKLGKSDEARKAREKVKELAPKSRWAEMAALDMTLSAEPPTPSSAPVAQPISAPGDNAAPAQSATESAAPAGDTGKPPGEAAKPE